MHIEVRSAAATDAQHLSRFLQYAAGGLIDALYEDVIPGKSTVEALEHVFSREESPNYYGNARIGLADGGIAGAIMMYRASDPRSHWSDPLVPNERRAVLRSFDDLQAEGLYINFVAVYPNFRGQGIGRTLLACARVKAIEQGLSLLSLHVFEQNEGAVRLYRRLGFEIAKRSPIVPHARVIYGGNIALMTCPL